MYYVLKYINDTNENACFATVSLNEDNMIGFSYYQLVNEEHFEEYILWGLTAISNCADKALPIIISLINP